MIKKLLKKLKVILLVTFTTTVLGLSGCQVTPDNLQNGVNSTKDDLIPQDSSLLETKASQPYVILYKHIFSGESVEISYGNNVPDFASQCGTLNNEISSIKCYNGAAVVLYDGANYTGDYRVFLDDCADFYYLNFNDVTSSLKWLDKNAVTKIAAGYGFSMAIKGNCSLYATGLNDYGQLGTGNTANKNYFTKVLENVKAVACGSRHTLALKWDGTLWATGHNGFGQLGTGDNTSRNTFVQVMSAVRAIACGANFSFALKRRNLYATGDNYYGQLGLNDTSNRNSFTFVNSYTLRAIASQSIADHSMALWNDGTVQTAGWNYSGQLGTGDRENRKIFVMVASGAGAIACGYDHSLILKNDGTLWGTGNNYSGQLGTGDNTSRVYFTKIIFYQ